MPSTTTLTVRLSGALRDFVSANVGGEGSYENVSEYIRDLVRRDQERFRALKAAIEEGIASGPSTRTVGTLLTAAGSANTA